MKNLALVTGVSPLPVLKACMRMKGTPINIECLYSQSWMMKSLMGRNLLWGQNKKPQVITWLRSYVKKENDITVADIAKSQEEVVKDFSAESKVSLKSYEQDERFSFTTSATNTIIKTQSQSMQLENSQTCLIHGQFEPNIHKNVTARGVVYMSNFLQRHMSLPYEPIVIHGYGPAALWLTDLCLMENRRFYFYNTPKNMIHSLESIAKGSRNYSIAQTILNRHQDAITHFNERNNFISYNALKELSDRAILKQLFQESEAQRQDAFGGLQDDEIGIEYDAWTGKLINIVLTVSCIDLHSVDWSHMLSQSLEYHNITNFNVKYDITPGYLMGSGIHVGLAMIGSLKGPFDLSKEDMLILADIRQLSFNPEIKKAFEEVIESVCGVQLKVEFWNELQRSIENLTDAPEDAFVYYETAIKKSNSEKDQRVLNKIKEILADCERFYKI